MSDHTPLQLWIDRSLLFLTAAFAVTVAVVLGFFIGAAQADDRLPLDRRTTVTVRPDAEPAAVPPSTQAAPPANGAKPNASKVVTPKRKPASRVPAAAKATEDRNAVPTTPPAAAMAVAPAVVTTPPAPAVVGVTPSADLSAPRPVRIETVAAAVRPVAERSAPPASRFSTAAPASSEPRPVGGETYVAGFFGINFPSSGNIKLSETQVPGCPAGTFGCPLAPGASESDLKLKNSVVYGAKVGHYFERLRWLGVEGEVFNTNAHEKQQNATINEPGVGVTPIDHVGATMRVLTLAANVLARYPGERFQPYAGIGLGLFFAHRTSAPDSHSSTQPGLNAEVGLRYRATDRVGLFGEYKYNRARLHFQETSALFARDETYQAHMLVFGAYLSFN